MIQNNKTHDDIDLCRRGFIEFIQQVIQLVLPLSHIKTDEVRKTGMKGFEKYFVKFAFKTFLKQSAYTKEDFEEFIKETPFKNYEIKRDGISLYVYLNK